MKNIFLALLILVGYTAHSQVQSIYAAPPYADTLDKGFVPVVKRNGNILNLYKLPVSAFGTSGSGGGTTYTAGSGINIGASIISVDSLTFTSWKRLYKLRDSLIAVFDARYLQSSALSLYLTSATAASTYQPIGSYVLQSRTITINGITQDLSANRGWTISGGGGSTILYSTTGSNTDGAMTQAATTTELGNKVDKVTGKALSTNDYDNTEKASVAANTAARHTHPNITTLNNTTASYKTADSIKLAGIAAGATVGADWNTNVSNKPTIPTLLSQLSGDATHRTVTDAEKAAWNSGTGGGGGSSSVSAQIYYTSLNGCVSDADLSMYSTNFGTDNTAALQAILDQASASNPIVIYWDGKYSVTGLDIKSHTTIITFPNCGAILRDSSNRPIITNYHWQNSALVRQDSDIHIIGGIWNANGNVAGTYHQTRHNTTRYWANTCFSFGGVVGLTVKDCSLLNSPTWTFWTFNSRTIRIDNVVCNNGSGTHDFGDDGIHVNGNVSDIDINNTTLKNINDDGVAFNADEVINDYPAVLAYIGTDVHGSITDYSVRNIFLDSCFGFGVRLLSGASRIDRGVIDGVHGRTTNYWLMVDNLTNQAIASAGNGNVGSLVIRNVDVAITTQDVMENAYAVVGCNVESLVLENYKRSDFSVNYSSLKVRDAANIKYLRINGLNFYNSASSGFAAPIISIEGGIIDQLTLSQSYYNNAVATTTSPLIQVSGGAVNRINLNDVTAINTNNIVRQTGGSIGHISATQITHDETLNSPSFYTTQTVPDIVLDNYYGRVRTGGTGTFTQMRGDGFISDAGMALGGGGGTDILFDDFNRANSTSSLGNLVTPSTTAWTVSEGTWGISSNKAYYSGDNSGTASRKFITADAGVSSGTLSCKVTYSSTLTQSFLVARYVDVSNFLMVAIFQNGSTSTLVLYRVVAGAYTNIGSSSVSNIAGSTNTIAVVLSGNSITVKNNNSTVITATESTFNTATKFGFGNYSGNDPANADGLDTRFDDFIVQ
jgi:hypothetical protein